jgi:hypothetical protein
MAGLGVLALLAALIVHNVPTALRNQRELPRDAVDELDDWFAVSSRDLEHVAAANPRHTVYGRIAVFYFLEQRIGGATLVIPEWWAWNRWELERVAHVRVDTVPAQLMIAEADAAELRRAGEGRRFQPRNHKRPKFTRLYLVREPGADRYVLVQSDGLKDYFVISEARYEALGGGEVGP